MQVINEINVLKATLEQMIKDYSRDLAEAQSMKFRNKEQVAKGKLAVVKALWDTYVEPKESV